MGFASAEHPPSGTFPTCRESGTFTQTMTVDYYGEFGSAASPEDTVVSVQG